MYWKFTDFLAVLNISVVRSVSFSIACYPGSAVAFFYKLIKLTYQTLSYSMRI